MSAEGWCEIGVVAGLVGSTIAALAHNQFFMGCGVSLAVGCAIAMLTLVKWP